MKDLARNFSEASKQNPHWFEPPRSIFAFFDGVTQSMAGRGSTSHLLYVVHVSLSQFFHWTETQTTDRQNRLL